MSKSLRYIANGGLFVAAVTTTLYLLMLGFYALPTADDWAWTPLVESLNPIGFVKHFYLTWQGRYSALLVDGALCQYLGRSEHLLGYTIVELLLGYGAVYLLLRDMLKLQNSGKLALVAITITNLGVMAFPEIGTFYWLCTSNYIHEIWFTLYLVWFIFCCKRPWLQWIGALFCSVYLGGCAENYSPVVALVLGCVWLYIVIRDKEWRLWKSTEQSLLFVSAFTVGVGFMVMFFAPGNEVRMMAEGYTNSLLDHFDLSIFIRKTINASVVLLIRLLSRGWYMICAFPLFIYLGTKVRNNLSQITWTKVLVSLCLPLGVIVVSIAASVLVVGWYATMRANCFIVFLLMAWVAYAGVLLGYKLKEKQRIATMSSAIAAFAVTVTAIAYIIMEYPIVRKYNQDVMAVHQQMKQYVAEGRTETVYIKPIQIMFRPSSYTYLRNTLQAIFHKSKRYQEWYFPYEPFWLDADSQNWRNQFYKKWLNAQFDIVCINEEMD